MILRGLILSFFIISSSASDNDFMAAVRSLIYGDQITNTSHSDGTPGLLPQSQSAYPNPPSSFGSYPQFTIGISGGSSGSACNLPQQIGTGPYRIPRWYFNPARMRCELFYWSGCCGNGNNFNTFQSCQQVCEGQSVNQPSAQQFLNVQESSQIPSEWLLTRNHPQISVSVEIPTKNCCQRPFSTGFGGFQNPRWYYESNTGSCQIYLYNGFGNPSSGFQSFEECQKTCQQNQQKQDRNTDSGPAPHIILPEPSNVIVGLTTTKEPIQIVRTTQKSETIEIQLPRALPEYPSIILTTQPPKIEVDPCSQDRDQGVGALQLPRFFFNKETKLCEQFIYFGSAGNRNNFMELEDCQRQCPESPNPCAYGTSSNLIQCGPGTVVSQTCSGQQFCHVGASAQTTVCCNKPVNIDRCSQPLNVGVGNSNLPRWYFNPLMQQCQQCTYKGLQGNENNFISRQDCENSCMVNPCQRGMPYQSQGITVQCSANNQVVCPAGYYCHIGGDASTTVCCQALVSNPCNELLNKGEGKSALTRFYYDADKRQCLPFNYLGTKGNTNNFISKETCEEKCPVWVNPCVSADPFFGGNGKPLQCSKTQPCHPGFHCHIGFDDETTVCCPSISDPCQVPMSQGTGPHFMTRWYYDQSLRQCKQFTYKGLHGNENNFLLKEHCERSCPTGENPCANGDPLLDSNNKPKVCFVENRNSCPGNYWCHVGIGTGNVCCPGKQDPCILAVIKGTGGSVQQRWYFDMTDKQCKQFIYRGNKGNSNNFMTSEQCEKTCPVYVDPCPNFYAFAAVSTLPIQHVRCTSQNSQCPSSFWCHIGSTPDTTVCCANAVTDPCSLPPRIQGAGELRLTRWSFDAATKKCEPFDYFGIKGNQNNFLTREACEATCPGFENPCKSGDPFMVNGRPQICKRETPCPVNYYCHIGANENKYCCPAVGGDPCGQPMDCGRGNAQLTRWYWNQNIQQCTTFSYRGQKGTQNNFLSKQDCDRTCYENDNPCALGEPQMISPTETRFCSIANPLVCAPSYWCHYGATDRTTLCCPGKVTPQKACQQPLQQGTGTCSLSRWYYNSQSQCCLPFFYKGKLGNENNFLTKEECEKQCVPINVCPFGEPQKNSDGRPLTCIFNGTQCAPSHFCHLGLIQDENQCCPGEPTNPAACQGLPSQQGVSGPIGTAAVQRWFYEVGSMTCKSFLFNGRKGNQNNFLTEADCAATCQVFVNPCNAPIAMPPQMCSIQNPTCNGNCWCHIGGSPATTVCCPNEGNPCDLPLNCGTGGESLPRWYYNQKTGTCESFNYCGLKGNQNNFLTREQCEGQCAPNPCAEGRPFVGVDGRTQTCSASASLNTCPASYWCHVGGDLSTTVCCPGASQNSCNLPMSTGEGNMQLERYYFDASTKTCKQFIYNGLKGNQNNFLTMRACQLACQPLDNPCIGQPATTPTGQVLFCSATNKDTCPVNFWCHLGATPETTVCCPGPTNPCSVPLAPGTGNAGLARWYYNPDDRECVPFQYNGKRGNQNNFLSQAECERTCPVFKNPCIGGVEVDETRNPRICEPMEENSCSSGYFCLAGDPDKIGTNFCCQEVSKDGCDTYLAEGQGRLHLNRWYYNPFSEKCQNFIYRGLKGNENNFLTLQKCEESCQPLSNVCFGGEEPLKVGSKIVQCRSNSDCPNQTHFCHIGAGKRANVCCKKQGNVCDQQLMIGVGDAKLSRFYYSEVDDKCIAFNYSGLAGNENNFLTKSQCEIACPGFRGFCPHGKPLIQKGKIVSCGIDTACPKSFVCHVTKKETKSVCCPDPASFCLLPPEPGPCRNYEKRYAYNKMRGICEKFTFGGCFGNLNSFESLQNCTEICCDKGYL